MQGIQILLSLGFLGVLTSSSFAQDIQPVKNIGNLITVCKDDKANTICETMKNGKLVRKIYYRYGKLDLAGIYYFSGRLAKSIGSYNFDAKTHIISIYPDKDKKAPDYNKDEYLMILEDGKFTRISNRERFSQQGIDTFSFYKSCKEETPNGTKCDELNYFYPSPEPDLHPAFALPIENQGLDVLKSNGIKIP